MKSNLPPQETPEIAQESQCLPSANAVDAQRMQFAGMLLTALNLNQY